jgi:hypothetical protein
MARLLTVPANRAMMAGMPTERVMSLPWDADMAQPPISAYRAGDHVVHEGNYYVAESDPGTSIPPAAPWTTDSAPVPLLTDAWRNPILFVPAQVGTASEEGGLIFVNPSNNNTILGTPIRPPDRRAFWASAGEDGQFQGETLTDALQKTQDNLYSFEN